MKLSSFIEQLLDFHKDQFKSTIEVQLVAKTSLQSALDVANMALHSISMAIVLL